MKTAADELRDRFDCWLRGELPTDAAAALLSVAASDPVLATEVAAYQDLLAQLRALPPAIAPEVDLWPGIASQLQASRARESRQRFRRRIAALAAAILLTVIAFAAWRTNRKQPVDARLEAVPVAAFSLAAYAKTDQTLGTIRDELRRAIEARQEKLPPETRALVFDNLRTIDRAIAEIEAALHAVPADPELARTYIAYRERQIDLLRQANRIAARL